MHISGVLLLGLSRQAAQAFLKLFQVDESTSSAVSLSPFSPTWNIQKTYLAVCHGIPTQLGGTIDQPLPTGESAITQYQVINRSLCKQFSLIQFRPITGRKRQLRVHAALALNTPILGDPLFPPRRHTSASSIVSTTTKLHLHALSVSLCHPILTNHQHLSIKAPWPPSHLLLSLQAIRWTSSINEPSIIL